MLGDQPVQSPARATAEMRRWIADLWYGEEGASAGPEWALIATAMVLGSVLALAVIRQALLGE